MKDEFQYNKNLKEKFQRARYKYTKQRQQVMEVILEHRQLHLSSDDTRVHHHLICSQCGGVIDLCDNLLVELENQICSKYNFHIKNRCFKFYGKCKKCRQQSENK
ncbi:Fur family transcriptional regulator [Clostridium sp.]|uniref:Fur family transcriptional regulator n=1 Tax=Clostridium sp. TaxID=1506 RepID=UPI00359FA448